MKLFAVAARTFVTLTLAVAPAALTGCAVDSDDYAASAEQDLSSSNKGGRFEIFVGQDGRYYFHLLAANGENVLVSEGYTTWQAASNGVKACRTEGVDANRFDLQQAKNGEWYFDLLSANGEVIATSELYATKSGATKAIGTVASIIAKTADVGNAPVEQPVFWSFKGLDGKFYFHLRARNGQIVLQSQGYSSKSGATKGLASVEANGVAKANYELRETGNGRFYFVLVAQNQKVIGTSQMYGTKQAADRGIDSLVKLLGEDGDHLPQ